MWPQSEHSTMQRATTVGCNFQSAASDLWQEGAAAVGGNLQSAASDLWQAGAVQQQLGEFAKRGE